jgi:protein required for attachment to host cells
METRVIVADSARARIFSSHGTLLQLEEIEGFAHPEAHLPNRELASDSAGKSKDQHGSLDQATSPRDNEAERFAQLLGQHLKDLHNIQHFEQLMLVAPPRFLGLLRKHLPKPLEQLVQQAVDKDLTRASTAEIIDCIRS